MFTALKLRFWKDTQLSRKNGDLNARIDTLVGQRRMFQREVDETKDKIALLNLRRRERGHDDGEDADLMNLQLRQSEIEQEINDIKPQIGEFEQQLEPFVHEMDRRRQKEHDRNMRELKKIDKKLR